MNSIATVQRGRCKRQLETSSSSSANSSLNSPMVNELRKMSSASKIEETEDGAITSDIDQSLESSDDLSHCSYSSPENPEKANRMQKKYYETLEHRRAYSGERINKKQKEIIKKSNDKIESQTRSSWKKDDFQKSQLNQQKTSNVYHKY